MTKRDRGANHPAQPSSLSPPHREVIRSRLHAARACRLRDGPLLPTAGRLPRNREVPMKRTWSLLVLGALVLTLAWRTGGAHVSASPTTSASAAIAVEPAPQNPPSLKTVRVPLPEEIGDFIKDRQAAIALGKAFFW